MNERALNRILDLTRSIPRDLLPLAEGIFRLEVSNQDVCDSLSLVSASHQSFRRLESEILKSGTPLNESILAIRGSVLNRLRHSVHAPKAVCTLPGLRMPGLEDTLSETLRLIGAARSSIYLMNYWMTGGSIQLLKALMAQMEAAADLKVILIGDSVENFLTPLNLHWRSDVRKPVVYVYRPGLDEGPNNRSKMHAKTLLIDEERMLITSANMTKAASSENIEVGISIEAPKAVRKIAFMINELIHNKQLFERC